MKYSILLSVLFWTIQMDAVEIHTSTFPASTKQSSSQQLIAKGKVIDENGIPLPGASVVEKNTNNGVITDFDGNFEISLSNKNSILVVSFMGYKAQEISATQELMQIRLTPDSSALDEIIVIGYGAQKKRDLTGSISSLDAESYEDQPVLNTSSALQGRVSGLQISNTSGAPGSEPKIHIRGSNSINSSNSPLYVIDGVALTGISLNDININDVKSIEVLKDASSTAIYGSRGANGVILVTTKNGRSGSIKVNYDSFFKISKPMKKYDLRNATTYADEANHISEKNVFDNPSSYLGKTTDWQDLIFQTGFSQSHNLAISGGTEKTNYFVSGNYIDETGLLKNTGRNRFTLRSNIETDINDKITVSLNLMAGHEENKNNGDIGGKGNPVTGALAWAPTEKVYDSLNVYNKNAISPIWSNPYMLLQERNNKNSENFALLNAKFKYQILDYLTLEVLIGMDYKNVKSAYLKNKWISPGNLGSGQGDSESQTIQNSNILTFHKVFKEKHDLNIVGLAEITKNRSNGFNADGSGLTTTSNGYYNLGLNTTQSISSYYSNWGLLSFMGRASYSYMSKYLLSATFRADGSSKFQTTSNKWGYFPSVGLGWRLSEENFIKNLDLFHNLKLRVSYGITGSQAIEPYSSLGLLNPVQYSFGTNSLYQGYIQGNPSNPNLKWETTNQFDLGLDMEFWNGRLNIALDYYNKTTNDLLLNTPIPGYNGGGNYLQNIGKVRNEGFEFSLDITPIETKNLSWTSTFNASSNKNEVLDIGDNSTLFRSDFIGEGFINTNIQVVQVGESLGTFYLIPWKGIYQEDDPNLGYKAGDNKYEDVNGDGEINFQDRRISGSAIPKVTMGWNNSFRYKNFGLNLFLQSSLGSKIFNATYATIAAPNSDVYYPTLKESVNYWTPQDTNARWADPASKTGRNFVESTQYLQNGSYLRLKNISLSYKVPEETLGFANVKISASAQNVFTITKYKGLDPEASSTPSNSDASAGIDFGAYPSPRTFAFSLNIGF